jgi:two-component system CheB/CheR fusion protein
MFAFYSPFGKLKLQRDVVGGTIEQTLMPSKSPRKELPRKDARPAEEAASVELPPSDFPIVGIGASAGGLEAFGAVLKSLPADTGMAFVIVQHLDPHHETLLVELLSRSTSMAVEQVREGTRVAPDRVYVIPPNTDMAIESGVLSLQSRTTSRGQHMPIDTFLRSLAADQQDRAIGVILSGTNSDGALGIEAVKNEGGITFAQDEKTAKFDGMPRAAVATKCVDFVLPPEEIARELARIAGHPYVRGRKTDRDAEEPSSAAGPSLNRIFALLRAATGVDFTLYKHSTIRRRIGRRMTLHKVDNLDAYLKFLDENPSELSALYREILIKVTGFFRDPEMFEALKSKVIPEITSRRPLDTPIRVWIPGCATGEEAYSIAIVILESLSEKNLNYSIQIFATDISDEAIEKARAGVYVENISVDVSPERLRRFFVKHDGGYQVSKTVRDLCVFARQNVTKDPPFSRLDMVSCRNLLIYMESALQKRIIPMYHYALKPDGFLLLGTSETVGSFSDMFELVDKRNKIYIKRATVNPQRFDYEPGAQPAARPESTRGRQGDPAVPDLQKEADLTVLAHYGPPGVVVNDDFEVVQFRGKTSAYIEPAPGKASLNLLKMAREGLLLDLRNAVQRAKRTGQAVKKKNIPTKFEHGFHGVDLDVIPLSPGVHGRHFLVLFQDSAPAGSAQKGKLSKADERQADQLKQELLATRQYLQSIIEEQEATNEELQSANEEILSSNEELQSINEELETAKEELQSTNEELTTVNEELQNRNSDLSQINDDLNNLLYSVNIAIVMLGGDLRIRRFTPMAGRVLNIIPADIGRPVTDLRLGIRIPDLEHMISEVLDSVIVKERELHDDQGRTFSMTIRPYRTSDNRIDGAVLVVVDVEAIRRGFDQNRGYSEVLQNAIEMADGAVAVVDGDMSFRFANPGFQKLIGRKDLSGVPVGETSFAELTPLLERALREGSDGRQPVELRSQNGMFRADVKTRVCRLPGTPDVVLLGIDPATEKGT